MYYGNWNNIMVELFNHAHRTYAIWELLVT